MANINLNSLFLSGLDTTFDLFWILLFVVGLDRIGTAVVSGMATATFILCLGHISNWRKRYEQ
jgi:hypothetical protein